MKIKIKSKSLLKLIANLYVLKYTTEQVREIAKQYFMNE